MRDAAGDVAPGGHPLSGDKVGHIVKGHHVTFAPSFGVAPRGHTHQQGFLTARAHHLDLGLQGLATAVAQLVEQRAEFRHRDRDGDVFLIVVPVQQPLGRAVDKGHPPFPVQPDHARGDRGQHAIEQAAALFDLMGVFQQRLALALQLLGHLVEVPRQHGDFVVAAFLQHPHVQITRPHALRRTGQTPDGAGQAFGEPQAQPDGGEDEDHSKTDVKKAEFKQYPAPFAFQLLVQAHGLLGVVQKVQDFPVDVAADIQIPVQIGGQRDQGAEFIVVPVVDQQEPGGGGPIDLIRRGLFEIKQIAALAPGFDLSCPVDDIGFFQPALDLALPRGQKLTDHRVGDQEVALLGGIQEPGQGAGVFFQILAVFLFIGPRGGQRRSDNLPDAIGKPALKPDVDGQNRKDGDGYRGDQRHDGKDAGQPKVQPRSRRFRPTRRDHARHPLQHQRRHDQHVDKVSQQHQTERARSRALLQGTKNQEGGQHKNRPKENKPQGRCILQSPLPPEPHHHGPGCAMCPSCHGTASQIGRFCGRRYVMWPLPAPPGGSPRAETSWPLLCCGFTSTCDGESR